MKISPRFAPLLAALVPWIVFPLLPGCSAPDGRQQAQATQSAITRTANDVQAADLANAQAQAHTVAAHTAAQRIDDKAVMLENARW